MVLDDDSSGRKVLKTLKDNQVLPDEKLIKITGRSGIEDLFSKEDFEKICIKEIRSNSK